MVNGDIVFLDSRIETCFAYSVKLKKTFELAGSSDSRDIPFISFCLAVSVI